MDKKKSDYHLIPIWNAKREDRLNFHKIEGIPCTQIKRWSDFSNILEKLRSKKKNFIYRGHRRSDWILSPTLARDSYKQKIYSDIAEEHLKHFKRSLRADSKDYSQYNKDEEFWAMGQHHGLMTPLLDWTRSPYVSLFFAFMSEDPIKEVKNEYRAVYILDEEFVTGQDTCPNLEVFEPIRDEFGRLTAQSGLFTLLKDGIAFEQNILKNIVYSDLEDKTHEYIFKVYIKNDNKQRINCLKCLSEMNIHHASLFPDLIGISEHCNSIISEKIIENNELEKEKEKEEENLKKKRIQEGNITKLPIKIGSSISDFKQRFDTTNTVWKKENDFLQSQNLFKGLGSRINLLGSAFSSTTNRFSEIDKLRQRSEHQNILKNIGSIGRLGLGINPLGSAFSGTPTYITIMNQVNKQIEQQNILKNLDPMRTLISEIDPIEIAIQEIIFEMEEDMDWKLKDSSQAKFKTKIRSLLRRNGYTEKEIEEKISEILKNEKDDENDQ